MIFSSVTFVTVNCFLINSKNWNRQGIDDADDDGDGDY